MTTRVLCILPSLRRKCYTGGKMHKGLIRVLLFSSLHKHQCYCGTVAASRECFQTNIVFILFIVIRTCHLIITLHTCLDAHMCLSLNESETCLQQYEKADFLRGSVWLYHPCRRLNKVITLQLNTSYLDV